MTESIARNFTSARQNVIFKPDSRRSSFTSSDVSQLDDLHQVSRSLHLNFKLNTLEREPSWFEKGEGGSLHAGQPI